MLAATLLAATLGIPGATNSGVAVAAAGSDVVAVWAAKSAAGTDVYAAFSRDGGATFGDPVRVNDVPGDARMSGEQPPRVSVAGGVATVVWISRQGSASVVRRATQRAGASAFQPSRSIHADGLSGARGWHSLALSREAAVHVVWLDGRDAHAAKAAGHASMQQDIFHALLRPDGTTSETRVARDVCFCCKTAVAAAPDGTLYAAWRHIFPPNVRDIAVARSSDGGHSFDALVRVSEDDWRIDGCPDDGPSLAVDSRGIVHIAWPTLVPGATLGKGIFYSFSSDGGRSFAPRVRVDDDAGRAAHPQLAVGAGRVHVVWDAGRRVRAREIGRGISTLSEGPAAYPAVAASSSGTLVAWTEETSTGSEIRVRLLP